jgi:hypothetical protein
VLFHYCLLEGLIELILNFVFHRVDIDLWLHLFFPFVCLLVWTTVFNRSLDDLRLFIIWGLTATALRWGLLRRGWWRGFRGKFKDGTLPQVFLFFVYLSSIIRFLFLFFMHLSKNLGCLFHSKWIRCFSFNIWSHLFQTNDLKRVKGQAYFAIWRQQKLILCT